ncbi:hypothetical protein [Niabella ginsengisoli]|uniref:CN hydrolase domain-containing protein n=1 Tax=Niabella ginsengisoli TaxID=522298 RepID=A0ABS9SG77_9BACT|nr:hypothetical protein [Niabella ginsengisoli]MCH5597360.1 hypothetical protein [Niabella ginsengisoli]
MNRKQFIHQSSLISAAICIAPDNFLTSWEPVSDFAKRLKPVGRALELEGYYVWCNTPIKGPDGKIHVFSHDGTVKRK